MRLPSVKQAFALHFLISLLVFAVLLFIMMRIWFPGDLFFMDGGWEGLKIIAPIDLILGPALTLLIYRPWKKKKNIITDMAIIATLQIAALGYGTYSAYTQRTAAIVFAGSRFETVSLFEIREAAKSMESDGKEVISLDEFGKMPVIVYAEPYADSHKYFEEILNGKPELRERTERYRPLDKSRQAMRKFSTDDADEQTIEIAASSKTESEPAVTPASQTASTFTFKARYARGTISLQDGGFEIQKVGH